VHLTLHEPQFVASDFTSTQAPPQEVKPVEQSSTHAPLAQDSPAAHRIAQAPQFLGSLPVSTQMPAQSIFPLGQLQSARRHTLVGPQLVPQPWQFFESDSMSRQALEQFVKGELQVVVHAPKEQTSLTAQTVAQVPQCIGSVLVLMQVPPQSVFPTSQTQAPAEHTLPPPQAAPQAPQCPSLELRSTHTPPQAVRLAEQLADASPPP
jgi:hypothetical protein